MSDFPRRRFGDLRQNRRMRKGMLIVPSLFTIANLGAGFFAIAQCMDATRGRYVDGLQVDYYHFDYAAIAIGLAAVADFLDGTIARLTGAATEFGKQLDSLADIVTFGVAPAFLAFTWGFRFTNSPVDSPAIATRLVNLGFFLSFLFIVASASRLARYNIQSDPRPSNPGRPGRKYFVGMPTPAGAGVIASTVHLATGYPLGIWWVSLIWGLLVFATGFLEVSTWRFFSPKSIDWKRHRPFTYILSFAALVALIFLFSQFTLFFIAMAYMLSGVITRLAYVLRRSPSPPPPQSPEPQAT
jgi:CDP-diacylglycerol--serine O-phosphatidyltransferase